MADKRIERMLEEICKLPGNNYCADCHSPSPRWASVNLGITLCVSCASIHRKLGTHKSRVKSVTLDTWTREQVITLRSIGNTASNAIYNPDERRHPPPTSSSTDSRDSDMEKYIRRKYEQGAFKPGESASVSSVASASATESSTSRTRFREAQGRDLGPWDRTQENKNSRNPELNDLVVRMEKKRRDTQERDLPPLPISASSTGSVPAPARERPKPITSTAIPVPAMGGLHPPLPRSSSANSTQPPPPTLIDLGGTTNISTLPLQSMSLAPPPQSQPFLSTSAPTMSPNPNHLMPGSSYFIPTAPNSTSTSPLHSPPALMQQGYNPFIQHHPQQQQQPMYSPPSMYHTNPFNAHSPGNPNQQYGQQLQPQPQQQQFVNGGMNIPNNGVWHQNQQPMQMGWMGQSQPTYMGGMSGNFAYAHQ